MADIKDKKEEEIKKIAQKYSLELLLLFGSRAEKQNKYVREDSDFDIAYLSKKDLNLMDEARMSGELAKIFESSQIDIVNIKRSSPLLMKQIFDNHIILYCKDKIVYYKYMIYFQRRYAEAGPLFSLRDNSIKVFLKKHAR